MKRQIYSLDNPEFAFLVDRIDQVLRRDVLNIPYSFVGGVAIQAYTLDHLCRKYGANISNIERNKNIRLQDHLRATDDIDIMLKFPEGTDDTRKSNTILTSLDWLEGEELMETEETHVLKYTLSRRGIQKPKIAVEVNGIAGEEIALNISRGPQDLYRLEGRFYDERIDQARTLVLPYSAGFKVSLNVPREEHLMAAKIAHFRPKDAMDIQTLVGVMKESGREIDRKELEKMLLPVHEVNYERFNGLIGVPLETRSREYLETREQVLKSDK